MWHTHFKISTHMSLAHDKSASTNFKRKCLFENASEWTSGTSERSARERARVNEKKTIRSNERANEMKRARPLHSCATAFRGSYLSFQVVMKGNRSKQFLLLLSAEQIQCQLTLHVHMVVGSVSFCVRHIIAVSPIYLHAYTCVCRE